MLREGSRRLARQSAKLCRQSSTQSNAPTLQTTTLPSGLRIATDSTAGHFASVGVYVNAGSRYESAPTLGYSHLLDRMTYSASRNRTSEQFAAETSALGGQFSSTSSRETMIYQGTTYAHTVPETVEILLDTALNPAFLEEDLERQKQSIAWEIKEIQAKPELILPEFLHQVAYKDNTIGNPLLCPEDQIHRTQPEHLRAYHAEFYRPERTIVAAAGVQHQPFVEMVERCLASFEASPKQSTHRTQSISSWLSQSPPAHKAQRNFLSTTTSKNAAVLDTLPKPMVPDTPAHYTGGSLYTEDSSLEFTHLYVGFESLPVLDLDNIYALAVLQTLLGGGGSFSAGGPGKGMYSRLYTHVLNQYYNVDFCSSFHHTYQDTGLFGINVAVRHDFVGSAARLVANQLESITGANRYGITNAELFRAKNQLRSSLMMALESRTMQVEDLARQIQAHGFKTPAEEMCARIDSITLQDVHRAASIILRPNRNERNGLPTVVANGRIQGMQDVHQVLKSHGLGL